MKRQQPTEAPASGGLKRELGLFTAVAIVIGQMIGTGIYMTPQGMAMLANPKAAILACAISGLGTLFLAACFAGLGEAMPQTGSAVVYTKAAFGDFAAFWVGWAYWCGCWIGDGAIILGGISYLSYFVPTLAEHGLYRFLITAGIIWFYTLLNIRGVREAGLVNLVLTVLKFVPLVVFIVIAIPNFDPGYLQKAAAPELEGMGVLPIAIAYILWSFIGFEGTSVNAGEVKNPRIIRQATMLGAIIVVVINMILIILAAGNMAQSQLAVSNSPFSDIIQQAVGGYWAGGFIALGVFVSAVGCIGAWILSSARIAYAMGEQKMLPKSFAHVHPKYGTPDKALLINGVLITIVLLFNIVAPQSALYNFLVLLAVTSFLIFYGFGAAAQIMLMAKKETPFRFGGFLRHSFVGLTAFAYVVYAIYGSGAESVMYGFLLLILGIPFYIYIKFQNDDVNLIRKKAGLK